MTGILPGIKLPKVVPNPCGEAETNRNWDAVSNFFNNVVTTIINNLGTRLAEIELTPDINSCQEAIVFTNPITFRPLYLDDPNNPTIPPEWVHNYRALGVAEFEVGVKPVGYIAFDPNEEEWELIQVDHVPIDTLGRVTKVPGGVAFDGDKITAPYCGANTAELETVLARAISALGLQNDGSSCILYSNEVELEVFAATSDPTNYVEVEFESVQVLTDLAQLGANGDIYGFYYSIYVPCSSAIGFELLIPVDTCLDGDGSGSGSSGAS